MGSLGKCWKCGIREYVDVGRGVLRCWYPHCEALKQDDPANKEPEAPKPVKKAVVRNPKEKA